MEKIIETSIKKGIVPEHAPSWAKLDDIQWIQKLNSIVENPDKYHNSVLKETLLESVKKEICNNIHYQYVGPTGIKKQQDLRADNDGDSLEEFLRRRSRL